MEYEDNSPHVVGDLEKRIEDMEKLQKRVEELERNDAARTAEAADLQESLAKVEKEKSWITRHAAIEKEKLDDAVEELEKEKRKRKKSEESIVAMIEREAALQGEVSGLKGVNGILMREVEGLKGEMSQVKRTLDECDRGKTRVEKENEELKRESGMQKGEMTDLRVENNLLKGEIEKLKRRVKEMEDEKLLSVCNQAKETDDIFTQTEENSANQIPKEENIDESQSIPRDNQIPALNFTEEDMKLDEEEINRQNMDGMDQLYGNGYFGDLSMFKDEPMDDSLTNPDEMNFKKEGTPNYDENFEMGDTEMGMENSLIDQSFNNDTSNLRTISNGDDTPLAHNILPSGIDEGIEQSQDRQETDQVDRRRRSTRNSSKNVKYNDSMEDSDGDGGPAVKKTKSECGQISDKKGKSSLKKDPSISARKAKKSDTEMECPECEFLTRSAGALIAHLRLKHNTTLHLAGHALLCECGHELFSSKSSIAHFVKCNIANFTVIRKRDGPIQRLDDEKVTPQCILCQEHPKTAYGYAYHLHNLHKSSLKKNGIYLLCSCGLKVSTVHDRDHNIDCNPRQFSLHKVDQK